MNDLIWASIIVGGALVLALVGYLIFKKEPEENGDQPEPPSPPEPPPIKKLAKKYRVPEIQSKLMRPIYLETLFIPEILWSNRIRESTIIELMDMIAETGIGNTLRGFLFSNCWSEEYCDWNKDPFNKNADGLFELPKPWNADVLMGRFINPVWKDMVIWVIKEAVKRKITFHLSLLDNCGLKRRADKGAWESHYLNPKNNNVNVSPENFDVYNYPNNPIDPKAQNTGKIWEAMAKYMIEKIWNALSGEERNYLIFEAINEGHAGITWHMIMSQLIDDAVGQPVPMTKKTTSSEKWQYGIKYPPAVRDKFIYVIHHVGTPKQYKKLVPSNFKCGCSADGYRAPNHQTMNNDQMKEITKFLMEDGNYLIEFLHGHRNNWKRLPGAPENTTLDKKWYDYKYLSFASMSGAREAIDEYL